MSYVWGGPGQNNLRHLKGTAGAVSALLALGKAPKTIQQAIDFTQNQLEMGYLWVDALCIVQDDDEQMKSQIASMAAIFANADVTLIAACGSHANAGLRPDPSRTAKGGSKLWDVDADWLRKTRLTTLNGDFFRVKTELMKDSLWLRRGWTLQELVFSRRAIYFTEKLLIWECHCSTWHNATEPHQGPKVCRPGFQQLHEDYSMRRGLICGSTGSLWKTTPGVA